MYVCMAHAQVIGVRAEFRPCDLPAYISLTVYETSIGFSYNVGKIAAGPHR